MVGELMESKSTVIKKKKIGKAEKKSANVPGQYLGYSLQTTRFLVRLLESKKGGVVSLEVFDDVGVESRDGKKTAEQGKSALASNPISDRATDLWKTFSNWLDSVREGILDIDTTSFEIYVSHPKRGKIVKKFSDAKTLREAKQALEEAKLELWGIDPNYEKRDKVASLIKDYVEKIFLEDEKIICKIIQNFTLVCGSGSPQIDLKELLKKSLCPDELVEVVLGYALGWVKKETDILLEKRIPANILVDDFRNEITSFIRKYDRRTILASVSTIPDQTTIENHLKKLSIYIKQLELIDSDDEQKYEAVSDFLRAGIDRTYWAQNCLIHGSSFEDFEASLKREWGNLKTEIKIENANKDEVQRGLLLYSKCQRFKQNLEGLEVPSHFTSGCFHTLSDVKSIGWHPDYKKKLLKN